MVRLGGLKVNRKTALENRSPGSQSIAVYNNGQVGGGKNLFKIQQTLRAFYYLISVSGCRSSAFVGRKVELIFQTDREHLRFVV